jgi:N utilization substance protein B
VEVRYTILFFGKIESGFSRERGGMRKRSRAREIALQKLYGWEISAHHMEALLSEVREEVDDEEVRDFAVELLKGSIEHKATLDGYVISVVENWEFERIALLDRLILRLALCELLYFEEIPPKVTINEAIDLAKVYSTAQSGRFVNGILDSLFKQFKAENKIQKKGRGLVDQSARRVSQ